MKALFYAISYSSFIFLTISPAGGAPEEAQVKSFSVVPQEIHLNSPFAYSQIIATAQLETGTSIDATRMADIKVEGDAVTINELGIVEAAKNGKANIILNIGGKKNSIPVTVTGINADVKVDYIRDVMPVISRLGCNAGTCHGAKDGKNGFKLSLRGYDPIYDIRALTDDLGSRRVNLAAPDASLMLLKATAAVPHEGSQVTKLGSNYYKILRKWIASGVKFEPSTPRVTKIEVFPKNPVVQKIGTLQQMRVTATYADGIIRDVTREAFVASGNSEVAEPEKDKPALITTLRRGEAPILVRFEGNYAATTVTVMGDREGFAWQQPPSNNRIDELAAEKWKRMKILPSALCDDYEFIRRAYLDITGLPPSAQAVLAFVEDQKPQREKRDALIDKLIGSKEYVSHWTNKWADLMQVNRKFLGAEGAVALREWIRGKIQANTPYNDFVEQIITASGSNKTNPAASYFKILRSPENLMENTTHLFLATRFNCNKCHDHPFERWTQDQYYQLSAYFAQVERKQDPASGNKKIGGTAVEGAKPLYEIISDKTDGEVKHERTGAVTAPSFPYLAGAKAAENKTRRETLAGWITSPENQYFSSSYVNRLWGYMLGTGIIEPLDDIRAGNPPSNPELLAHLSEEFIKSGFNVQHVLKLICKSRTYQLSIATNRWNEDDAINFSHAKARRLPAEALYDTIYTALGAQQKLPGVPAGTRAAELPDVGIKLPDGFLDTAGRPVRESACECERSNGLQLGPIMALVSGPTVGNAISDQNNILPRLVKETDNNNKLVNEIFMRLLARPATNDELTSSLSLIDNIDNDHQSLVASLATREAELKVETDKAEAARQTRISAAKSALEEYQAGVAEREAKLDREQAERISAAEKSLKDFEVSLPEKIAVWSKASSDDSNWQVITPIAFNATSGSRLELENDSSIYASGKSARGKYHVFGTTEMKSITGIRIEALPDERLPKKGPGRADNDGNFVLTEFDVFSRPTPANEDWKAVNIWGFDKPGDTQGWGRANQLDLKVENGTLKLLSKGKDPHFITDISAPAGSFMLDLKAEFPGKGKAHAQLFWTTKKDEAISETRSTRLTLPRGKKGWGNYRFYFETDAELTSIRIDPSESNSDVFIDAMRLRRSDSPKQVKLQLENAKADFSQDGYPVATAIDGNRAAENNGWGIAPQMAKSHSATFEVKGSAANTGRRLLRFDLDQQYKGNRWNIGRFRISITNSPKPINFGLPGNITGILAKAEATRTDQDKAELTKYYRENNTDLKNLVQAVAEAKKAREADPKLADLEGKIKEAESPLPVDSTMEQLRKDIALSEQQKNQKRLTGAQDIAWAIINTPAFLFNR
ncbi:MAG: DUF1549 domain-containing protein [Verrucomicrobiaceae bacterium]|nr:DUF1549 domain-containing protein [Verrucomicrobiaceae bacterium]